MHSFAEHNPIAVAVYFLCTAGIAMFCMHPVILALSLLGALICCLMLQGIHPFRPHLYALLLLIGMTLLNPLISHRGATILFVMNHNPVTLEALIYGAAAGSMVLATLYWFRSFSHIMTSDKLLYLFGALSPKLSLILSMTLRYVPLFGQQVRKVHQSQQSLGLYKEDNIADRFRGGMRIFSVMVTWALENGIITADSMTARGYGVGRRSRFTLFCWNAGDRMLLAASILLTLLTALGLHGHTAAYYPQFSLPPITLRIMIGLTSYGLLTLLPVIIQGKEALRWHCLTSRI